MIIIEGPDGAGKTTLSMQLKKEKIVRDALLSPRRVYPEMSLYESTRKYCNQYLTNHKVAVDRFIFSELCYGIPKRGRIEFTQLQTAKLLADILGCGCYIIFCLPDVGSLLFKVDEDKDTISKIKEIHAEYFEWSLICRRMALCPTRIIRYQWNLPHAFDILKDKLRRAQSNERQRLSS